MRVILRSDNEWLDGKVCEVGEGVRELRIPIPTPTGFGRLIFVPSEEEAEMIDVWKEKGA